MEFMATHWHCVLPLIGIAAYLLCVRRGSESKKTEDNDRDLDLR
ncbi:hypothetical protein AGMMS49957_03900 [Synergistales bacterium]|nr:hypothetical protein AGMMS49957_03900 [Synergistales bacterium]